MDWRSIMGIGVTAPQPPTQIAHNPQSRAAADASTIRLGNESGGSLGVPNALIKETVTDRPEVERLVTEYVNTFRRVGYLSGPDLKAARDRIIGLARTINVLAPDFNWHVNWHQIGAVPMGDPAAMWDADTAERVGWLASVDAEALAPFRLPSGRWVPNPYSYLSALRRDAARGPGSPLASQVAADLHDVAIALRGDERAAVRPTIEDGPDPEEWDPEMAWLIAWLKTVPTPSEPFRLDPWREVSDPLAFVSGLQVAIAQGPQGPRARSGALRVDLESFHELIDTDGRSL